MSNEMIVYQSTGCEQPSPSIKYASSNFKVTLRGTDSDSLPADFKEGESPVDDDTVIMCILWKNGKLAAAYYNQSNSELYVVPDIFDTSPEFLLTKTLFHQIRPNLTITVGTTASKFVEFVVGLCRGGSDGDSVVTQSTLTLPPNVQLLKLKEFQYENCKFAVTNLRLSGEPANATDHERQIFLNSILNFSQQMSVHALGALLTYLNKYSGHLKSVDGSKFTNVNVVSIRNTVLMDADTFNALQIFNAVGHPASFKHGRHTDDKEGLSVFRLLNRCRSYIGQMSLRAILLNPTNDIEVLRKRQEFIAFCLRPVNDGILRSVQNCLKYVHQIGISLTKIYGTTATLSDWKKLYFNVLAIHELCAPHVDENAYFKEFVDSITEDVYLVRDIISHTIDFDGSSKRVTIKTGIDEELDTKKRYRDELKDKITLAATYEIQNLPTYINDCSMVYIPEIGYLVAVQKWSELAEYSELERYGFRHYFTLGDIFHFKSAVCDELDECLGDIHTVISAHESRIILRLSQHVYGHSVALKRPLKLVALFDSLMSFAEVAKELNYVCPTLTEENVIEILDGRHPLLELCMGNFVPNDYISGTSNAHVKIITGPNASGKSIYLKQNALIVYLAHVGCYVPARQARIGMMASIHSRIQSVTSSAAKMSAFMIDLRQMSEALYCSSKNSLIVIDEFGKGTAEFDGLALLTAMLETFLIQDEFCPHIVVSTHFLILTSLIEESALVEHAKFDFTFDDDKIVFLHKLIGGASGSYATEAARNAGTSLDIVERSKEILRLFNDGKTLKHLK